MIRSVGPAHDGRHRGDRRGPARGPTRSRSAQSVRAPQSRQLTRAVGGPVALRRARPRYDVRVRNRVRSSASYRFGSLRPQASSTRSTDLPAASKSACSTRVVGVSRHNPPRPVARVSMITTFSPQRVQGCGRTRIVLAATRLEIRLVQVNSRSCTPSTPCGTETVVLADFRSADATARRLTSSTTSGMTCSEPYAPVPTISRLPTHGMSSAAASGRARRDGLEAFLLRRRTSPPSMMMSCSLRRRSTSIDPRPECPDTEQHQYASAARLRPSPDD
jgi:hypothetical protein